MSEQERACEQMRESTQKVEKEASRHGDSWMRDKDRSLLVFQSGCHLDVDTAVP